MPPASITTGCAVAAAVCWGALAATACTRVVCIAVGLATAFDYLSDVVDSTAQFEKRVYGGLVGSAAAATVVCLVLMELDRA